MQKSNIFSNKSEEYVLDSLNLNIGFGLYLKEEDYCKYIKGKEKDLPRKYLNDYICLVKNGTINFLHYGPTGLPNLKPSKFENNNLSFCEGLYCYNSDTHVISDVKDYSIYYGTYTGDYVECIYDCDSSDEYNNKGEGNLKEYVLLIKEPIDYTVEVIK